SASSVNLGALVPEEHGSGRDRIAEAVESGVDLGRPKEGRPETGSYAEVVVGDVGTKPGDSAGDLGAPVLGAGEEATGIASGAVSGGVTFGEEGGIVEAPDEDEEPTAVENLRGDSALAAAAAAAAAARQAQEEGVSGAALVEE